MLVWCLFMTLQCKISQRPWLYNLEIITVYSTDFPPSDLYVLQHLKTFLANRCFHNHNQANQIINMWFASQSAYFYNIRKQHLVLCYDKCSKKVENVSKGSVKCVHQTAIKIVWKYSLLFLTSALKLTVWISLEYSAFKF